MNILLWVLIYLLIVVQSTLSSFVSGRRCTILNLIIGSLTEFFVVYYSEILIQKTILKVIILLLTIFYTAFFYNNFQFSVKTILLFLVEVSYVFIVLGIYFAIREVLNSSFVASLVMVFVVLLTTGVGFGYVLKLFIKQVNLRTLYFKCKILSIKGGINLWMYLDSGNCMTVGHDQIPVVFINKSRLKKLSEKVIQIKANFVAGKEHIIDAIIVDEFYIYKNHSWVKHRVVIGLVDEKFYSYDGILNIECI